MYCETHTNFPVKHSGDKHDISKLRHNLNDDGFDPEGVRMRAAGIFKLVLDERRGVEKEGEN